MLRFLRRQFSRVVKQVVYRDVKARYEVTEDDHTDHWRGAVASSPNTANNPWARERARNKGRHERENSVHISSILEQYSSDVIGTSCRFQLLFNDPQYDDAALQVEESFCRWSEAVDLTGHLTILVESAPVDGDSFLQLTNNPGVDHPVKLGLRGREAEEIQSPDAFDPLNLDGVIQDEFGNAVAYWVARTHPNDTGNYSMEFDRVPADSMCHWFRPTRAGQARGMSKFASVLESAGAARRYSKAQLAKQELNAHIAAAIEVDAPLDGSDPVAFKLMDEIPIPRSGMISVPKGSNPTPFKPAENTVGYEEYMAGQYSQMGRPLLAPRNLVTGDSSKFNFASGRLDHLPWQSQAWRERSRLHQRVLRKIVKVWYAFALQVGEIPRGLPPFAEWKYQFQFDGFAPFDEVKAATAQGLRIQNGTSTLAEECALEGRDYREVIRQRALEKKLLDAAGLSTEAAPPADSPPPAKDTPPDDGNDPDYGPQQDNPND